MTITPPLDTLPRADIDALKPGDKVGFRRGGAIGISAVKDRTARFIKLVNGDRVRNDGAYAGSVHGWLCTVASVSTRIKYGKARQAATVAAITEALQHATPSQIWQCAQIFQIDVQ